LRFDLIDSVVDCQPDKITAVKLVSNAEEYLGDHFPGFPVLPGVLMLETMVQAARKLVASLGDGPTMPLVISEVRNIKYGSMVQPGQSLRVEVTLRKRDEAGFDFAGVGKVDDEIAVQGRFRLVPLEDETG
jgi:3-hydroxyacyl-[acyl-carrier-protein] dehydratase